MSNATDSLDEAEKMIRDSLIDDQERALQICCWLLGFNSIEKGFKVKCYSTKIKNGDICFCIDRSGQGDCERERVQTYFYRIRKNELQFGDIKLSAPYLERKFNNKAYVRILSKESKNLELEKLKYHIFESYELQLNKLVLVSNVPSPNNKLNRDQPQENSNRPSKEDVDTAELQLRNNSNDEVINEEAVLDQVEKNLYLEGIPLKENWRETTKQKIPIWFSRRT